MKKQSKDELRELMVAALYDEIGSEERAELEASIAEDDELRSEWEELVETQAMLGALDPGSMDSNPVDLGTSGTAAGRDFAVESLTPFHSRWRMAVVASGGFLLAATLFICLLVAGLRVDTPGPGLRVSFGVDDTSPAQSEMTQYAALAALEADMRYMTREEFAAFAQLLIDSTAARFDQLERRQDEVQTASATALYDALAFTQQRQFDDLRARLELATQYGAFELRGANLDRLPVRNLPGGQQR